MSQMGAEKAVGCEQRTGAAKDFLSSALARTKYLIFFRFSPALIPSARISVICGQILLLPLLFCGCAPLNSYQLGTATLYPSDIHTVYVPMFESDSFRRHLGERLTEAVVKEIELKTPYKVVGSPNADSVLSGRIIRDTKRVLVENRFDEPREIDLNMQVQVAWADRKGDLIVQGGVPLPPTILDLGENTSLVPEYGQSVATAQQEVIQRLAEQIVALMEMPW